MKESLIVQNEIAGKIKLEDQYNFDVSMSIGMAGSGDFYLHMGFPDPTIDELKILSKLSKHSSAAPIRAELIDREEYNLAILSDFLVQNNLAMDWDALTDEPFAYMVI